MEWSTIFPVLSPGYFVRTQSGTMNTWVINVILKISKDAIIIPYLEEHMLMTNLVNDVIKCKFIFQQHEIILTCIIREVNFDSQPSMNLKIMRIDVWKNVRNSERFDVHYLCKISSKVSYNSSVEFNSVITNLSESGVAIICSEQMEINSNVRLEFYALGSLYVNIYATVVRAKRTLDNKIEYGVKFLNITEDEKHQIDMIIAQIKSKEEHILNKFCLGYGVTPRLELV